MQLRSLVAVAVVKASSCSSDATPSRGTSICCRYSPKKRKKARRQAGKKEGRKEGKKEGRKKFMGRSHCGSSIYKNKQKNLCIIE